MNDIMKYSWKSADGLTPNKFFRTHDLAYADMKSNALELVERESAEHERAIIGIDFGTGRITVTIGLAFYVYEIVAKVAKVAYLGETWNVIEEFDIEEFDRDNEDWWFVSIIPDENGKFAGLWMDNNAGRMALLRPNGQILQRYF